MNHVQLSANKNHPFTYDIILRPLNWFMTSWLYKIIHYTTYSS